MRETITLALKLLLITAVAGLLLGMIHDITLVPINEQARQSANVARKAVFPNADDFIKLNKASETEVEDVVISGIIFEGVDDNIDNIYVAISGDVIVGVTGQITVKGFGGDIEITVGMDMDGKITGLSVGGPNFKETEGYGSKAKDPEFTEQFIGKSFELILKKTGESHTSDNDVDAITGATSTSRTVVDGVNALCKQLVSQIDFIESQRGS
ncbi:MAG: FMN-binding protein [Clostridiales bacterium]|nr:FMN-binding protein [Clostridiales bacterium]